MSERVVHLGKATAPALELVSKRSDQAMVVGDCTRSPLVNLTESWITTRKHGRTAALRSWQRPKTVSIGIRVVYELVNSVMAEVAETHRSFGTDSLLPLEAPPLVLRTEHLSLR